MTSLDSKLRKILLVKPKERRASAVELTIAQIKQAFTSEGYKSPHQFHIEKQAYASEVQLPIVQALNDRTQDIVDGKVMTGQEFYTRFADLIKDHGFYENVTRDFVLEAAKRAAGLKDD